ncbi:lipopolysaccharide biosynthesis protein, partial [Pseudomonas sp. GP01-A8]
YEALAVRKCAKALVPSVVVTLGACAVPAAVVLWPGLAARHVLLAFELAVVGGGAGWLLGLVVARHPLLDELKRVVSHISSRYRLLRG